MKTIDLHVHSNCSDGTLTPKELVDYAIEKELQAFALTDHDSVAGLEEALSYARELSQKGIEVPEVIPGIELSTEYLGRDVHVLGLFIDYQNQPLQQRLHEFITARDNRNRKMCKLLAQHGIDITYEKILEAFPDCVLTRAHYARYLLDHGYTKSMQEAFERYVGDHGPCYVPREKITPAEAVRLILEADGIPVLAHPVLYHFSDAVLEQLVAECKEAGLIGLEAVYASYSPSEERQMRRLAQKYHLLLSGGSDFHGTNKPGLDLGNGYGSLFVPEALLTSLKASRSYLLFTDMDGTLLNHSSAIYPEMKEALDRLTAAGHHLILSSGRPLPSILEVRDKFGLHYPNMLIISYNGALVYDCDAKENIMVQRLAMDDIRFIIGEAEKKGLHIHAYTDTEIVARRMNDELRFYTSRIHLPVNCVDSIPDNLPDSSFKLQCIHLTDRSVLEAFREYLMPFVGDRIQMIFSNDQYLEILPAAAGKGSALRFVEEYLHIPHSHTYAAGDAENDLSMLEAAGVAVAMANATPAVKAAADLITAKDNEHNGLIEIVDRILGQLHWASVWGNAVSIAEHRPVSYGKNITLRYPVYSAFEGYGLRLTFDNYCGTEPITITGTTVCIDGSFLPITFEGKRAVTIDAGTNAVSDALTCHVKARSTLQVSFYLEEITQMRSVVFTCGPLSQGSYAVGDHTQTPELPLNESRSTHYFYFLSNVSVLTERNHRTIVCYGDSITAQDWPDYLALRCREEGYLNTAIIRRATSGSRILREYHCIEYESYGLQGTHRFSHEVPTDGADTVLIQQGINDIIHPVGTDVNPFRPMSDLPTVEELIEGMKYYIGLARSYGYRVYVGTLLPIEGWRTYAPFREEMRQAFNDWIRTTDLLDGCVDFDLALRDPNRPSAFLPAYDSGDHLHPSKAGYKAMADAVNQELLVSQ